MKKKPILTDRQIVKRFNAGESMASLANELWFNHYCRKFTQAETREHVENAIRKAIHRAKKAGKLGLAI